MTGHQLTKTLDFNLNIESGDTGVLEDATRKARTAYNKTLEYYFNTSKNYETIREELIDEINLIKNTVQLIADKTYEAIQNYYETEDHNRPKTERQRGISAPFQSWRRIRANRRKR